MARIPQLVNLTQLARLTGFSRMTVYRHLEAGKVEGVKAGGIWLFNLSKLNKERYHEKYREMSARFKNFKGSL